MDMHLVKYSSRKQAFPAVFSHAVVILPWYYHEKAEQQRSLAAQLQRPGSIRGWPL